MDSFIILLSIHYWRKDWENQSTNCSLGNPGFLESRGPRATSLNVDIFSINEKKFLNHNQEAHDIQVNEISILCLCRFMKHIFAAEAGISYFS